MPIRNRDLQALAQGDIAGPHAPPPPLQLPPAVGGQPDLVSTIAFKQATGKGAVSIQATGALTSARIF
jgi:hypothetical protein